MYLYQLKFEYRNTKYETISNDKKIEIQDDKESYHYYNTTKILSVCDRAQIGAPRVWNILTFDIAACALRTVRNSYFEFRHLLARYNPIPQYPKLERRP